MTPAAKEFERGGWKVRESGFGLADGNLAAQVLVAQEAEWRKFSREMHDDLAQKVALLEFQIEGIKRQLGQRDEAIAELESLSGSVAGLAEDLHRICHRLHPVVLDTLGLVAGIDFLCGEYARLSGVRPKLVCEALADEPPANVALCLYRVIQEALSNIHKHAGAKRVTVALRRVSGGIRAIVSDDGCGFEAHEDDARQGLGLVFLCERVNLVNGRSSVRSTPGKGTTVEVFVPISHANLSVSRSGVHKRKGCNANYPTTIAV
jgi:signal transduction histidine kinase